MASTDNHRTEDWPAVVDVFVDGVVVDDDDGVDDVVNDFAIEDVVDSVSVSE